ncbi:MAG: hypothetical protein Q9210_001758 [Variospora velana]
MITATYPMLPRDTCARLKAPMGEVVSTRPQHHEGWKISLQEAVCNCKNDCNAPQKAIDGPHKSNPLLGLECSMTDAPQDCLQKKQNSDGHTDKLVGRIEILRTVVEMAEAQAKSCSNEHKDAAQGLGSVVPADAAHYSLIEDDEWKHNDEGSDHENRMDMAANLMVVVSSVV